MNKPNLIKSQIYNAISAMELKAMNEIHDINVDEDKVSYYIKLGEIQTLTKIKHFIADYPVESEEEKDDTRT